LPEVNCTYWEPYRPYLRGDIVCRFEPNSLYGGARDYTITAYMCRVENVLGNELLFSEDNDLTNPVFLEAANPNAPGKSQLYSRGRSDLCTGPVWETVYSSSNFGGMTAEKEFSAPVDR